MIIFIIIMIGFSQPTHPRKEVTDEVAGRGERAGRAVRSDVIVQGEEGDADADVGDEVLAPGGPGSVSGRHLHLQEGMGGEPAHSPPTLTSTSEQRNQCK